MSRGLGALLVLLLSGLLAACQPHLAPPGSEPGTPRLESARESGTEHFVTADGLRLTMRSWLPVGPPRAVILALHGFNDYGTFIAPAAEAWKADGIATYAYDQRGFGTAPHRGLWAGAETYAADARAAAKVLAARYPATPLYLLGESMGGAIAIAVVTGGPELPVDGVILAAPSVWARADMPFTYRAGLYLASRTLPWLALRPSGIPVQASDNVEALRALGRDPLIIKRTRMDTLSGLVDLMDLAQRRAPELEVPALILYGEKDELVPPKAMQRLWERLPSPAHGTQTHALYPEGWHLLFKDLQAQTVIDDVAHWIEDPNRTLPSAADLNADGRLAVATD